MRVVQVMSECAPSEYLFLVLMDGLFVVFRGGIVIYCV